jgi:AraC-like DNA-binding protein
MIEFQYHTHSFTGFLEQLAAHLGVTLREGILLFPPGVAEGYMKVITLPNGLEVLISNFRLLDDLLLVRKASAEELYAIICEELLDVAHFSIKIDEEIYEADAASKSALYLTSFLFDLSYFFSRGTYARGFRVLITREWLARYLRIDLMDEVLQLYLSLKVASVDYRPLDFDSRRIMNEIVDERNPEGLVTPAFFQNRVLQVTETFLEWMYLEVTHKNIGIDISRDDIDRVMRAEALLLKDFSIPAPTIIELARDVSVSTSKLKNDFKKVYNLGIYEYYQKKRMQKAMEMLRSGKSVKEVGFDLGYINLSNFTIAFKKEFDQLPSDVVKK